jgi:hypothetical protein
MIDSVGTSLTTIPKYEELEDKIIFYFNYHVIDIKKVCHWSDLKEHYLHTCFIHNLEGVRY